MAVNKVILSGETLIDLSGDTVTSDVLLSGFTAHGKDGNKITGSINLGKLVAGGSGGNSNKACKIVLSGETLIDLTGDDIIPEALFKGYTAHMKDGSAITGALDVDLIRDGGNSMIFDSSNRAIEAIKKG